MLNKILLDDTEKTVLAVVLDLVIAAADENLSDEDEQKMVTEMETRLAAVAGTSDEDEQDKFLAPIFQRVRRKLD